MIELKMKRGGSLLSTLLEGQRRLPAGGDSDLRGKSVIPLYLRTTGKLKGRITITPEHSVLLTPENLQCIPSGTYMIFVYSRLDAAQVAAQQHEFYGLSLYLETGRAPSGDGVLVVRRAAPAPQGQHAPVLRPHLSIHACGQDGPVSIEIVDLRDTRRVMTSKNPEIASSLTLRRDVVQKAIHDGHLGEGPADELERGERAARIIARERLPLGALRVLQDRIEDIPGARITIEGVSAPMVVDHIEDILDDEGADPEEHRIPGLVRIHRILHRLIMTRAISGSGAAREAAEAVLASGHVRLS